MKKVFPILTAVLLLIGLTAYSCKDELVEEFTGSIVGTVADRTTGEPVPTVNVTLEPGGKSAITGSDGNYLFSELEIGSYTVSVSKQGYTPDSKILEIEPEKVTNGDFLIGRIPSVVTVDRDTLDFGDGSDVNSLSFNIVNSGYEDLEWKIEYSCSWISEVRDTSGILPYGKTQSIVVFIDRELLSPGENTTTVVVRSSNGSSDLVVKAVGAERAEVMLNTLDVEDITSSTAAFYGEIINAGMPRYTARGFVYSTSSKPTEATAIETLTAPVTDDDIYSARVTGLELGQQYYVRAFAKSDLGTFYSTNEESFTPQITTPAVSVQDVSNMDVAGLSVVLNGTIEEAGDPIYTEKGFVYGFTSSPTIYDTRIAVAGNAIGLYSTEITGLVLDRQYYVRAYAVAGDGSTVVYSSDEVSFTVSIVPPEVIVSAVTDIDPGNRRAVFNGSILSVGDPAYTEKGFIYGTVSTPLLCDDRVKVDGTGAGPFSTMVDNLQLDVDYNVWAYAVNEKGETYSNEPVSFLMKSKLPELLTRPATDVDFNNGSAVFRGVVVKDGIPPYTERGFVYSTINTEPTVNDTKIIVPGTGIGDFNISIEQLPQNVDIYVRAYAANSTGIGYGNVEVISDSFIEFSHIGLAIHKEDIGAGDWDDINDLCENSFIGGYNDWRLPTLEELQSMYNERNLIGGFKDSNNGYYWSSTWESENYVYVLDFDDGNYFKNGPIISPGRINGRCVRTLE